MTGIRVGERARRAGVSGTGPPPTEAAGTVAAVRCGGVVRRFGKVTAVDGLDLELVPGGPVALLGRNGAGKSTTLSLLLGLDRPDSGEVRVFGRAPGRAVREGLVGAMLQNTGAVSRVTVREVVSVAATAAPRPIAVGEAMELAGIAELGPRRVDRLSGGQQQRVRFALAVVGDPWLLVLDEPTATLDAAARRAFWASLRAFADRGRTVLFSTHYIEEADENAERIVVIDRGQVVADGSGAHIKRSVGGRLVSLDLTDTAPHHWARFPGVLSVSTRGGRLLLRSEDSDATVRALAAAGAVHGLEVAPARLEEAFLDLTEAESAPAEEGR
ncbi:MULTISPECIES: ABC transporter ATP-binding protein [Streptomyces]|uniref:ATP-binding cassette domain-containing protein n=1 Tax=Streptomyces rutgersensis TaxID=53451 RepID=A0ABX6RKQ3_9ACTN|nr:sulfate ABC transporter ATP-binding protein [Streptomyces sp. TSRI0384-2]QNE80925.1 ATP-binding cassette domain-containing protein [Streptomyces rutgersensis]